MTARKIQAPVRLTARLSVPLTALVKRVVLTVAGALAGNARLPAGLRAKTATVCRILPAGTVSAKREKPAPIASQTAASVRPCAGTLCAAVMKPAARAPATAGSVVRLTVVAGDAALTAAEGLAETVSGTKYVMKIGYANHGN